VIVHITSGADVLRPRLRPVPPQPQLSDQQHKALVIAAAQGPKLRPEPTTTVVMVASTTARGAPKIRPSDLAAASLQTAIAAAANAQDESGSTTARSTTTAAANTPNRQTIVPRTPSGALVSKTATQTNQLSLNRIALLGTSGSQSKRRAVVRLTSGRVKRVSVGDRLDGGQVVAIGQGELRYVKGGKNLSLKMPRG
jgi:hypothetical protein